MQNGKLGIARSAVINSPLSIIHSVLYSPREPDQVRWNPEADVTGLLREYSRYLIGPRYEDTFAQGLLALERNWVGAVFTNRGIDVTLRFGRAGDKQAA